MRALENDKCFVVVVCPDHSLISVLSDLSFFEVLIAMVGLTFMDHLKKFNSVATKHGW